MVFFDHDEKIGMRTVRETVPTKSANRHLNVRADHSMAKSVELVTLRGFHPCHLFVSITVAQKAIHVL